MICIIPVGGKQFCEEEDFFFHSSGRMRDHTIRHHRGRRSVQEVEECMCPPSFLPKRIFEPTCKRWENTDIVCQGFPWAILSFLDDSKYQIRYVGTYCLLEFGSL